MQVAVGPEERAGDGRRPGWRGEAAVVAWRGEFGGAAAYNVKLEWRDGFIVGAEGGREVFVDLGRG